MFVLTQQEVDDLNKDGVVYCLRNNTTFIVQREASGKIKITNLAKLSDELEFWKSEIVGNA